MFRPRLNQAAVLAVGLMLVMAGHLTTEAQASPVSPFDTGFPLDELREIRTDGVQCEDLWPGDTDGAIFHQSHSDTSFGCEVIFPEAVNGSREVYSFGWVIDGTVTYFGTDQTIFCEEDPRLELPAKWGAAVSEESFGDFFWWPVISPNGEEEAREVPWWVPESTVEGLRWGVHMWGPNCDWVELYGSPDIIERMMAVLNQLVDDVRKPSTETPSPNQTQEADSALGQAHEDQETPDTPQPTALAQNILPGNWLSGIVSAAVVTLLSFFFLTVTRAKPLSGGSAPRNSSHLVTEHPRNTQLVAPVFIITGFVAATGVILSGFRWSDPAQGASSAASVATDVVIWLTVSALIAAGTLMGMRRTRLTQPYVLSIYGVFVAVVTVSTLVFADIGWATGAAVPLGALLVVFGRLTLRHGSPDSTVAWLWAAIGVGFAMWSLNELADSLSFLPEPATRALQLATLMVAASVAMLALPLRGAVGELSKSHPTMMASTVFVSWWVFVVVANLTPLAIAILTGLVAVALVGQGLGHRRDTRYTFEEGRDALLASATSTTSQ